MKIRDLREYLNGLPEELDNFDVVYSEAKSIVKEGEGNFWSRLDMPVHSIVVDQDHEEMVMGTMETIDIVVKMGEEVNESEPVPVGMQTPEDTKPLANGSYPALWSGYNVEIKSQDKTYNFDTTKLGKGVRGMNCPATAVIKDGEITDIFSSKEMKNV
jgi:hypothetical protein